MRHEFSALLLLSLRFLLVCIIMRAGLSQATLEHVHELLEVTQSRAQWQVAVHMEMGDGLSAKLDAVEQRHCSDLVWDVRNAFLRLFSRGL